MSDQPETFEKHGFFEELYNPITKRVVGLRYDVELGDRVEGFKGRKTITLEGEVRVQNGHKTETIRFKVPTEVISTIYPICGRML